MTAPGHTPGPVGQKTWVLSAGSRTLETADTPVTRRTAAEEDVQASSAGP
jgi:hypothetical protein